MQNAPPSSVPAEQAGGRGKLVSLWVIVLLALLVGAIVGLGGFTFAYAQGFSYLSNDPAACVNCHIMREQYDGWAHGTHHAVAGCNDCHAPHDNLVHKYFIKGVNGVRHSYAFTTGNHPEPIRITDLNREVAQHACLYCHGDLTQAMSHAATDDPTDCLTCHEGVGHDK